MGYALGWSSAYWLCIGNGWGLHPGKEEPMYLRTGTGTGTGTQVITWARSSRNTRLENYSTYQTS